MLILSEIALYLITLFETSRFKTRHGVCSLSEPLKIKATITNSIYSRPERIFTKLGMWNTLTEVIRCAIFWQSIRGFWFSIAVPKVLRAYTTYVRLLVEHDSVIWSPYMYTVKKSQQLNLFNVDLQSVYQA